jgi:hypothetical protein
MKSFLKIILILLSIGIGVFIFVLGTVGGESTTPNPWWWYALMIFFFGAPIVWLVIEELKTKRK